MRIAFALVGAACLCAGCNASGPAARQSHMAASPPGLLARRVSTLGNGALTWQGRTAVVVSHRVRTGYTLEICSHAGCRRLGLFAKRNYDFVSAQAGDQPVVVWTQTGPGGHSWELRAWDGATHRLAGLPPKAGETLFPSVAGNARGEAVVAWSTSEGTYVARRRARGTFDAPERVGEPAGEEHVAISPAGDLVLVGGAKAGIVSRYAPAGHPFGPARTTRSRFRAHPGPSRYKDPGVPDSLSRSLDVAFTGDHRAVAALEMQEYPAHEEDCADEGSVETATLTASAAPSFTTRRSGSDHAGSFAFATGQGRAWLAWTSGRCYTSVRLHAVRIDRVGGSRGVTCTLPAPRHMELYEAPFAFAGTANELWVYVEAFNHDFDVRRRLVVAGEQCQTTPGTTRFTALHRTATGIERIDTRDPGGGGFDVYVRPL